MTRFPKTFWLISMITFFDATAYYSLVAVATKMISIKYNLSYDDAKNVPLTIPLI